MDQRLVGAGDAMDMVTASHTKHEGRTPGKQETGTSCTDRALICLEICKTDLISGHKSWGRPKSGPRSQGETSVSVTGLQLERVDGITSSKTFIL